MSGPTREEIEVIKDCAYRSLRPLKKIDCGCG